MLKWQVSPPSVSSQSYTTDTSTSCASDSDATITPERCRRFQIHRKPDKSTRFSFDPELLNTSNLTKRQLANHRLSYESSELTNITDLGNFSDLERISDNELHFNEVFTREESLTPTYLNNRRLDSPTYLNNRRLDSPTSSILTPMEERDIYTTLHRAFREVQTWMSFVLKVSVPKEELFEWLKDGTILRKFATKLSQHHHKRLKKFTKTLSRKNTDNVSYFLKVCKKFHLSDAQLFHPSDWEYVITKRQKNTRVQHLGWIVRARKIISTFALLVITLKNSPKYEGCVGKCKVKYLKEMVSDLRPVQQFSTSESIQSSPSPTKKLMPPSCLYDSDASFRNRRKKVTFQDNVQQHVCRVENTGKPYFTPLSKDAPPPKYEEFIAMKKPTDHLIEPTPSSSQKQLQRDAPQGLSFSALKADTLQRKSKVRDGNNNDTNEPLDRSRTLPRNNLKSQNTPGYQELSFKPGSSLSHGHLDSIDSQNEALSLYNPVSYITGTQTKKSQDVKKSSSPQTKKKSPLVKKAASFINKASSNSIKKGSHSDVTEDKSQTTKTGPDGSKPAPNIESQILKPDSDTLKTVAPQTVHATNEVTSSGTSLADIEDRNKMNTLTKAEINDLNDLLSMFDEKEKLDPSIAVNGDSISLDIPNNEHAAENNNRSHLQTFDAKRQNRTPTFSRKIDNVPVGTKILDEEPRRSVTHTPTPERKIDNSTVGRKILDNEPRRSAELTPKSGRKTLGEERRHSANHTPTPERKMDTLNVGRKTLDEEPRRSGNHTPTFERKILHEEPSKANSRAHSYTKLNDLKHHKSAEVTNDEHQKQLSRTKNDKQLDYLQDVVSELLAVGNVDINTTRTAHEPGVLLLHDNKNENSSNITRSIGSIENFFDDIENQQASHQRILNESSTKVSSEDESDSNHNEVFSTEGNDSGIDETMPGLTKDASGQKRKSGRHRSSKHSHEEHAENKKSKHKSEHKHDSDKLKRSESESKRSGKHKSKDDSVKRTNSLPRASKASNSNASSKGDVTIRIDGFNYNSENIGRHGRSKERRSEPVPYSSRPLVDQNVKSSSKTRKLEPIITNKVRYENDIEGGAVGNHKRAMTDSHVYKPPRHHSYGGKDRSISPEKKGGTARSASNDHLRKDHHNDHRNHSNDHQRSRIKENNAYESMMKKRDSGEIRRNNSVHINSKSNEYIRDTPDGKHRVYVRAAKHEDPGPLPKKGIVKEYDQSIRGIVGRGKPSDSKLIDQLGVTPDIIQLLKEEEKFWHRQQELKEWRKSRDRENSHRKEPPPNYNNNHRATTTTTVQDTNDFSKRNSTHDYDAEVLREAEENRMALRAQKLMKVRAEQEHILKTSRENLLDDTDNVQPKLTHQEQFSSSSGSYPSPKGKHFPAQNHNKYTTNNITREEHRQEQRNLTNYSTSYPSQPPPPVVDRNAKSSNSRSYSNSSNERLKPPPTHSNDTLRDSSKPKYVYTKISMSNGGCFSDDDEVFNDNKRQTNDVDQRGYFSDDGFRDNTVSKTYLARPMYRQQKNLLRCTACVKLITEQRLVYVDGQNFYWHSACFKCVVCKALLNDSSPIRVRIVKYNLHCRFCYSARNGEQLSEV